MGIFNQRKPCNNYQWIFTRFYKRARTKRTGAQLTLIAVASLLILSVGVPYAHAAVDTVSVSITCNPNPVLYAATTQCTVTLTDTSPTPNNGAPHGTVTFTVSPTGGTFSPSATCTLGNFGAETSNCSVNYSTTLTGTKTITGTYTRASSSWANGATGSTSLNVSQRTTSTSVSCSPTSILAGTPTNCSVTVSDTSTGNKTTPTGTLTMSSTRSGSFTTCSLSGSNGNSTCSSTYTPGSGSEGSITITATYSGDTPHSGSSGTTTVTSTIRTSTTSVVCSPFPDPVGAPTTCTATISDSSPGTTYTPTGTVTFSDSPLSSGSFSSTTCILTGGSCSVNYTPGLGNEGSIGVSGAYGGDTDHASSSSTFSLTATARATSTIISCNSAEQLLYTVVTCTATIADTSAGSKLTPTSQVMFTDNPSLSGSFSSNVCNPTGSGGTASCSITYSPSFVGLHTLTANYTGETDLSQSIGSLALNSYDFSIAVTPSITVLRGSSATYAVTLTLVSGSTGTIPPESLSVLGLPADSTFSFSPATRIPTTSGATATLTVNTLSGSGGSLGDFSVSISGNDPSASGGSRSSSSTLGIYDFSITVVPSAETITRGDQANYTVTVSLSSGSTVTGLPVNILLSLTGAPASSTTSLNSPIPFPSNPATPISTALTIATSNSTPGGTFTLTVTGDVDAGTRTGQANLTILIPTVSLNPSSGIVGTTVTVSGLNFRPSATITITFDSSTVTTSTTDQSGAFSTTFTVPLTVAGPHTVTATGPAHSAHATFTLTPSITLIPGTGVGGTTITVFGTGFGGTSTINIKYDGTTEPTSPITITTSSIGAFNATFNAPASANGAHTVTAVDTSSDSASATFSISTSLTLSPTSGTVGSTVTATGTGFSASSTITIKYDGTSVATSPTTVTTTASGSFSATFSVPSSTQGVHTVTATDAFSHTASGAFSVAASISLSPASGLSGSSFTATGTGFAAAASVNVMFDATSMGSSSTSSNGGFTATFTAPAGLAGAHTITATDASSNSASSNFTLIIGIGLSPATGPPGSLVTVSGTSFSPLSSVTITYGSTTQTTATTDASGSFTTSFNIPASPFGSHTITATDASSNAASAAFSVTASITLGPTSGPVGATVTVTGTGFASSSTITIKYDGSLVMTSPTTVATSTIGSFSATFQVPASSHGVHLVLALDVSSDSSSAAFSVSSSVSINPTSNIAGSNVTVSGAGFASSSIVTIKFDGTIVTIFPSTVITSTSGSFTATITVPASSVGSHSIAANDAAGNSASTPLMVLASVTIQTTISVANAGPTSPGTVTGCDANPTRIAFDGNAHSIAALPSCTVSITVPTDSSSVRYRFAGPTSTATVNTCSSGSCSPVSLTVYDQLLNTYTATPNNPTTWDAALSIAVTGTITGLPQNTGCTISTINGGGSVSCQGWFDYNTQVTVTSPIAISSSEQWAAGSNTFTDVTGGLTHIVSYTDQFWVTLSPSPYTGGTTNPSGSTGWLNYGSTVSITATANPTFTFTGWTSSSPSISFSPSATSNPVTATVKAGGIVTANFVKGLDCFGGASSTGSLTTSVTVGPCQGNDVIIVLVAQDQTGTTVATVTDTSGLTFARRIQQNTGSTQEIEEWWAKVGAASIASDTITATTSGIGGHTNIIAVGFSGIAAGPFDTNPSLPRVGSCCSTQYPLVTGVSTSNANDIVFGLVGDTGPNLDTAGSGLSLVMTQTQGSNVEVSSVEYETLGSTLSGAAVSFDTPSTTQNHWAMIVDALIRSSAQPAQPVTLSTIGTNSVPTISVSGCSVIPTSLQANGVQVTFAANPSCTLTFTVPADTATTRFRFNNGGLASTTWSVTTCGGGTCTPQSNNVYYQLLETLSYSVTAGGSPSSPTITSTSLGSSVGQALTTTATGYWFDSGASWSVTDPISGAAGERWQIDTTSQADTGTFSSSQTKAFIYYHQYFLTVTSSQDTPTPPTGWVTAGMSVTESVTSPISAGAGTRYITTGWSGTGSVPPTGASTTVTFTINSPSTVTWIWQLQYLLTVQTNGLPSSHPSTVSLGGVASGTSSDAVPFTIWINAGASTGAIGVDDPVNGGPGVGYFFTNWDDSQTSNPRTPDTMNAPVSHTALYGIDNSAPSITFSRTPGPNSNGWNNVSVSVTWTVSDPESGIDSSSGCSPTALSAETSGTVLTCSATNGAGLTNSVSLTIKIDETRPSLSGTASPAPNSSGWNNGDVTFTFSCTDSLSGISAGPLSPQTISTEGTNQSRDGTCVDKAGNSASVTIGGVNIDKTPPVITSSRSSLPNVNGWYNVSVTVGFACSDVLSGVSTFSSPSTLGEGAGQSVTGTCLDVAGNSASTTSSNINIDLTKPTIVGSASPSPNSSGWNNGNVTISFTCSDTLSGVDSASNPSILSADGRNESSVGTCVDKAGNSASVTIGGVNIDKTPPVITSSRSSLPNVNGWYNVSVTVSFACSDVLSGVSTFSSPSTLGEGAGQSVTGTCLDVAGNSASTTSSNINIDLTKPTISSARSVPPNNHGWNNSPVTVSFACTDILSGVNSLSSPTTLGEGLNQTVTGTCIDLAGNSESTSETNINIDLTLPSINGSRSPGANGFGWNNSTVTVSFTCTDALSGVDTLSTPTTLNLEGPQSVTGTCIDQAGNSASATVGNINIDLTPPNVTSSRSIPPNANGWNNSPVTVSFGCSDSLSGVLSVSGPTTLNEGQAQSVSGRCTDRSGNTASTTESNVNIDLTPPSITGVLTPSPNADGWVNMTATVTFSCMDSLSGISYCSPPLAPQGEGLGLSVTGFVTDLAGNNATYTYSNINIDKTLPVLTITRSPQPNQNGWNNVAVTITFACSDSLSGIAQHSGPATISTEGKDQSITGTCVDKAGNTAALTASNINVDLTLPTVTGSRNPGPDIFGGTFGPVTVTFICTDPLSGVANVTSPITLGNGDGQSVTGTCTDGAGNQAFTVVSGINVGINTSLLLLVILIVASALSTFFLIMFRRKRRSQFIWDLPPNQGSEDAMPKPTSFAGEDTGTG